MTDAPPALWRDLRTFTSARVALGRAGNGLPTEAHLAFQAAHAAARDAVHASLDVAALRADLTRRGIASRVVASRCADRRQYLLRPDLGRALAEADATALAAAPTPGRLAFVVCDGLSALAVQSQAAALLATLIPALEPDAAVVVARQGRVALGDAVAEALGASCVVVLIGERPGLSAPDSLGVYVTWQPRIGCHDAQRNCVSNIRPGGLAIVEAARTIGWLVGAMRRLGIGGVALKDESAAGGLGYDRSTTVLGT